MTRDPRIPEIIGLPEGHEDWHVVRLGPGDTAWCAAHRARLERQGYSVAPPCVYMAWEQTTGRYEAKGDLYMWKPRGGLL